MVWWIILIETIVIDDENEYYTSQNGSNVIVEIATNKLISGCNNSIINKGVTEIADYSMVWIASTTLVIPDSVTIIGKGALISAKNLTTIFYEGTEAQWSNIELGYSWNYSANDSMQILYYSEEEPETSATNTYWHYVDGVPTIW